MISGFTFVHNGLNGGYPFVEAIMITSGYLDEIVVVDMESDDGTREVLEKLPVRIVDGKWGSNAGDTLRDAHDLHRECKNDTIIHFEADEVYDPKVILAMVTLNYHDGINDAAVWRLQLEQNFQRVRWYPTLVHRMFRKGEATKHGHTTKEHLVEGKEMHVIKNDIGWLWDITNCFKDNVLYRRAQQQELWHGVEAKWQRIPEHFHFNIELTSEADILNWFDEPHWDFTNSPFNLPWILEEHIGKSRYEPLPHLLNMNTGKEIV